MLEPQPFPKPGLQGKGTVPGPTSTPHVRSCRVRLYRPECRPAGRARAPRRLSTPRGLLAGELVAPALQAAPPGLPLRPPCGGRARSRDACSPPSTPHLAGDGGPRRAGVRERALQQAPPSTSGPRPTPRRLQHGQHAGGARGPALADQRGDDLGGRGAPWTRGGVRHALRRESRQILPGFVLSHLYSVGKTSSRRPSCQILG